MYDQVCNLCTCTPLSGGNGPSIDLEACKTLCSGTVGCNGFTYWSGGGTFCYLCATPRATVPETSTANLAYPAAVYQRNGN